MKFKIMEEKQNLGPVGSCKCEKCDYEEEKVAGVECTDRTCPNCNIPLIRKGGECD